jgi:glycosyltransferase 2 family protein
MRQVFGPGSTPLSRIMGGLVFLGGLALLGGMLWQVGLAGLRASFQALGLWVVPFLLLDSISLLLHTVGWAACFQRHQLRLRLWQLCLVRMAGNAINRVTPTADLGGEVVKVMLLTSALPQAQAVATVLIDKASIALAQMGYLTLGTLYLTGHLPLPVGVQRGIRLSMGLILLGLVGFVAFQRYGLLSKLVRGLGCLNIGQARLHQLSQRLAPLDAHLVAYYTAHPWRFGLSWLLHFLAFAFDGIQTYILLRLLLGEQAPSFAQAIMVAIAVVALEQMFFFVPGSLGTLEMSRFKTLSFLGVDDGHSVAFALTMRLHNLFWNGLGLLAYALCTHRAVLPQATQPVAPPPAAAPPPGC